MLTGRLPQDIVPERVTPACIETTARRRGKNDLVKPSLLSVAHWQAQPNKQTVCQHMQQNLPPARLTAAASTKKKGFADIVRESHQWDPNKQSTHPILIFLKLGRKQEKGWLRLQEAETSGTTKPKINSHLSDREKHMLVQTMSILKQIPDAARPKGSFPMADLAHALGKSQETTPL